MIRAAVILTLLGLSVSLAHLLWPTPLLFSLFMIAGQGSFGLAMALYGAAVLKDLRSKRVL
jgi:hypothetical protein